VAMAATLCINTSCEALGHLMLNLCRRVSSWVSSKVSVPLLLLLPTPPLGPPVPVCTGRLSNLINTCPWLPVYSRCHTMADVAPTRVAVPLGTAAAGATLPEPWLQLLWPV
jgi:hypothetical protein